MKVFLTIDAKKESTLVSSFTMERVVETLDNKYNGVFCKFYKKEDDSMKDIQPYLYKSDYDFLFFFCFFFCKVVR